MGTFRIFLDDLFASNFEPKQGEVIYELHSELAHEADTPYVHQSERVIGKYGSRVKGKPHLFTRFDGSKIHSKNCYIKREYLRFPLYASKYIHINVLKVIEENESK